MSLIPNAKTLDPGWVTPKGIFTSTGATVVAWNTKAFAEGKARIPGRISGTSRPSRARAGSTNPCYYNYEAALLAAGTSRTEVYPVTDEKIKLVFEKMREIKPHIKVWWTAGAQPPQLLSSGELAISSAWSGRMYAGIKEKAPIMMTYADGIGWGNAWVIPKGAPHAKLAMEAINYAISDEAQMRMLEVGTYRPVSVSAASKGSAEQKTWMVAAPENITNMLIMKEDQTAIYSAKYETEWNRFLLA